MATSAMTPNAEVSIERNKLKYNQISYFMRKMRNLTSKNLYTYYKSILRYVMYILLVYLLNLNILSLSISSQCPYLKKP